MPKYKQQWQLPANPKPIVIIGAGGIVADAHLPAYKKAGFRVDGIYDLNFERAQKLAMDWNIENIFNNLEEAVSFNEDVIFDLALPPAAIIPILNKLPDGAAVLIQKPMGEDFRQALEIRKICREKKLKSAVNFQMRFSPMMLALKDIIDQDIIGEILDVEMHLNVLTPWELFPFLKKIKRMEIAVHSIHYLDFIRSLVGEPKSVFAKTMPDKRSEGFAQTKTSAILDYGQDLRCVLSLNHNHKFGRKFQHSHMRIEGRKGALVAKIGVNLNYPDGETDELWLATDDTPWQQIDLIGEWFPDAFIGTMSNLQRFVAGEDDILLTSTEDAISTMALVEACFIASEQTGTLLPKI